MTRLIVYLSAAVVVTLVPSRAADKKLDPSQIGHRDVGKGVNFYSWEREIELGREMAHEVELESRVFRDEVVAAYVNRLGQNLVRNSDATVPFTIKVLDSEEVNAFALPGGFLYVNAGLIRKTASEAELAGVMAHEIAHVAARHGTRQATRGQIMDCATIPLVFVAGWPGYALRQAAGLLVPLGFLKFSRGMESEADLLGLEYLYQAGYDPTAFVDFFERLEGMEKNQRGTFSPAFSSHPLTAQRIHYAQRNIQRFLKPKSEYVVDTSEFQAITSRLEEIERRRAEPGWGLPELRHRGPGF